MNNLSLFIPRVFSNISKERIINTFESNNIGKIKNVDFVAISHNCNKVYVHFEYYYETTASRNFIYRIQVEGTAKLVYDDPWFWIVLENKSIKPAQGSRQHRINLEEPQIQQYIKTIQPNSNNLQHENIKMLQKTEKKLKQKDQSYKSKIIDIEEKYRLEYETMEEEMYDMMHYQIDMATKDYNNEYQRMTTSLGNEIQSLRRQIDVLNETIEDLKKQNNELHLQQNNTSTPQQVEVNDA
jgi:transketolase